MCALNRQQDAFWLSRLTGLDCGWL